MSTPDHPVTELSGRLVELDLPVEPGSMSVAIGGDGWPPAPVCSGCTSVPCPDCAP